MGADAKIRLITDAWTGENAEFGPVWGGGFETSHPSHASRPGILGADESRRATDGADGDEDIGVELELDVQAARER